METSSKMFSSLTPPQLLFCEEDDRYLDYDVDVLKNFRLFSSTFSVDELMKEIPWSTEHPSTSAQPVYKKSVRQDCMWSRKVDTKESLEININNNCLPSSQTYNLVPPDLILSVRKKGLFQPCTYDLPSSSESFHSSDEEIRMQGDVNISPNSTNLQNDEEVNVVDLSPHSCVGLRAGQSFYSHDKSPLHTPYRTENEVNEHSLPCTTPRMKEYLFDEPTRVNQKSCNQSSCNLSPDRMPYQIKEIAMKNCTDKVSKIRYTAKKKKKEETPIDVKQSPQKRKSNPSMQHNMMERVRRINLREKYQNLRKELPSISGNVKVPKVKILKEAIMELKHLTYEESNLNHIKRSLIDRYEDLQQKYSDLHQHSAAS
ncbi:myc proto-oncogene protein-like [Clytia hemisphaerica]|uniref:BHLH domain-containing protein n=1 Tax=Clytia hemisphaerica TaxID=252671 RepID=A0A7M5X9R5_9CNID